MGIDHPKMCFQKYFSVIYVVIGTLGQRGKMEFLQIVLLPGGCEAGANQIY